MAAGLIAAALVALAELTGRRGVDLAAAVHRIDEFRRSGWVLWDFSWYGGHWTLGYSVLYPALGALLGVAALAVVSAAAASVAFDRLVRPHLGPGAWLASVVFAVGTLVSASIGQMPFLTGEAFGLWSVWALARRRSVTAILAALLCTLVSPLTGAFTALAAVAVVVSTPAGRTLRSRLLTRLAATGAGVVVVTLVPVGLTAVLFPGQGPMPYPFVDYVWEVVVAVVVAALAGRDLPALRTGALLVMVSATFAVTVPSALGGNVGRIEDMAALPLAVGLAWKRARILSPVLAVPLALSQWVPAWGALTYIPAAPSSSRAFYAPLDRALTSYSAGGPVGRVEVVPTAYHWEAAYVASTMALARGWERQLDVADNPIFYRGSLTPNRYRAWLVGNGVRFVALPSAPLDMAAETEAALVGSGRVPGLRLVWHNPDWRLYSVEASPGIVSGPGRLVSAADGRMVVEASAPGQILLRIRYSPDWTVTRGAACVTRAGGSWTALGVAGPEQISLGLDLVGSGGPHCPSGRVSGAGPGKKG